MRETLSSRLIRAADSDPRVVVMTGDHGYALFDEFRSKHPDKYLNAGIAEQNMIGMAAGLAKGGFRPIVYGLSAFIPVRVLEQIKLDIAHDGLGVMLLGDGAGFVYSHLGTSHQSAEDIACLRSIPNVSIYSPADSAELEACFDLAFESRTTTYMRIGKADRGHVHDEPLKGYRSGDLVAIAQPQNTDFAIIATGSMVSTAQRLSQAFPQAAVWSAPTIKPINADHVIKAAQGMRFVISLEEHSIMGGLGTAITEILSERLPMLVMRVGINDRFSKQCGSYEYLLREHGLDDDAITLRIRDVLNGI